MLVSVCPPSGPLDLSDNCVRLFWSAAPPAVVVVIILLSSIPLHPVIKRIVQFVASPWREFLTISEAEAYELDEKANHDAVQEDQAPLLFTLFLSTFAMMEVIVWTTLATYGFAIDGDPGITFTPDALHAVVMSATWLYAAVKPVVWSRTRPPYDLLIFYILHLIGGTIIVGGMIYDRYVFGVSLPPNTTMLACFFNILTILCLSATVLTRPVGIPSTDTLALASENFSSMAPEDFTSLWGWISFSWMSPLIRRGQHERLDEEDVWKFSYTMRAKPVFMKFNLLKRKSLPRRILAANSLDMLLDASMTFLGLALKYAKPFFLKRIIDSLGDPSPERRAQAYILACLAFLSAVFEAGNDIFHLWYLRRAYFRVNSALMSTVYNKALKRKDFSGITNKRETEKKLSPDRKDGAKEKADGEEDEPKAGGDFGKIVNIMSGDASRVAGCVTWIHSVYGAPFDIAIACVFLYHLLGSSAFAGFVVLLFGWPLNSLMARRNMRIWKAVSSARDKRMSVVNEIMGAINLIKLFAWEDRWIQRALDSRSFELKWLLKSRINSVMFEVLFSSVPILVSALTFTAFIVGGNELTLGTALTAITVFGMLRGPLNALPIWIIHILESRVALQRLETFLNEEEVDDQVSSIKRTALGAAGPRSHNEFGIRQASFRWNTVEDKPQTKAKTNSKQAPNSKVVASAGIDETVAEIEESSSSDAKTTFQLSDISVIFPNGRFSVVTGPTASGKTALLLALLGEMTMLPGGEILMSKEPERVDEHGLTHSISYSAQTPWLQQQSIKDNILFGHSYDESRYKEVIECCALGPDLKVLEDGDETEIGARGVSLSGGQKARVALARAVYPRTKFVLLDDPLSAVDSHTSRFLYERLLLGPLMRHRTVILVTHHVELVLPGADYLVRMSEGRIDVQGAVEELRSRGLLESVILDSEADSPSGSHADEDDNPADSDKDLSKSRAATNDELNPKKPRKLITEERRESGGVKWVIYKTYLKASSYWTWAILFAVIILAQSVHFSENYWMMVWSEAYDRGGQSSLIVSSDLSSAIIGQQLHSSVREMTPHYFTHRSPSISTSGLRERLPSARDRPLFYVTVYALIGFVSMLVGICSSIVEYAGSLLASRNLFKSLLVSVIRATMRWQDVTPTGRTLSRFSNVDINAVDEGLASSIYAVNSSIAGLVTSKFVVISVFPFFVIPATIFGIVYYYLAIGYLAAGRDLRRMEAISRSPIVSAFEQLLEGVVTVRAFSAEQRFMSNLYSKIDLRLRLRHIFMMTNSWLSLRFDCLGALAAFTATILAISGIVSAGWAALSITSIITFTYNIDSACKCWIDLELDLNAVDRVVEYLHLPQEPPAIIDDSRPPAHWPSSTSPNKNSLLVVENLSIRYAPELPAVLHGVSFSLKARERVGLLGRTGSGKSTLAMSVLRFVEPSEGRIMIDGIDITTIGVYDLRSRLTFIPQEAKLFSGTLRENLDPFRDHSDDECLDVLYRVQMLSEEADKTQPSAGPTSVSKASVSDSASSRLPSEVPASSTAIGTEVQGQEKALPKITLDSDVSAGGLNFSAGQRQLIAMARALLRKSAIVVMDEATSSIDFETDAKIQAVIREEFTGSLLLTIAHRLHTVIDYDRLIVLDQGKISEFDTPWNLINKKDGIFREMCLKSGSYVELEWMAKSTRMLDSPSNQIEGIARG